VTNTRPRLRTPRMIAGRARIVCSAPPPPSWSSTIEPGSTWLRTSSDVLRTQFRAPVARVDARCDQPHGCSRACCTSSSSYQPPGGRKSVGTTCATGGCGRRTGHFQLASPIRSSQRDRFLLDFGCFHSVTWLSCGKNDGTARGIRVFMSLSNPTSSSGDGTVPPKSIG